MAVKIHILDQKFYDQFHEGVSYAPNLVGSAGEVVRVEQTVQVHVRFDASPSTPWKVDNSNGTSVSIELQAGSWLSEGFAAGDGVWARVENGGVFFSGVVNITSVSDKLIILDSSFGAIGTFFTTEKAVIILSGQMTALDYRYNLIDNASQATSWTSAVNGEEQRYYVSGIGTSFADMHPAGASKAWNSGACRVKFDSYAPDELYNFAKQIFKIEHTFCILPFYREGELANLQNLDPIAPFVGQNTLKYAQNFAFSTSLTNPSGRKEGVAAYTKGSVAWFGETFNGLDPEFELASIEYEDSATLAPADALRVSGRVRAVIIVTAKSGAIAPVGRVGLYTYRLPTADEYTNKPESFAPIWQQTIEFVGVGAGQSVGAGMVRTIEAHTIDAESLAIVAEIEPTAEQSAQLRAGVNPSYLIAVQVGYETLSLPNSNKIMLLADARAYSNEVTIPGLAVNPQIEISEHWQAMPTGGSSDFQGWVEDGLFSRFSFSVDLSKQAKIISISQAVIAAHPDDLDGHFELDSNPVGLGENIISNGVQQIGSSVRKPYPLAQADSYAELSIRTGARIGDLQAYAIGAGQKLPWQAWQKIQAATQFFDTAKPQNGLNRKASNYSGVAGWNIHIAYKMLLSGVDEFGRAGDTEYVFYSAPIAARDYLTPAGAWEADIETFDPETLADLEGAVLRNGMTLYRITWRKTNAELASIGYAINRIEAAGQSGWAKWELSTIAPIAEGCPLRPLAGNTGLAVRFEAGAAICECLIDGSKLPAGATYNLSGRVSEGIPAIPPNAKRTEDGQPKRTEAGEYKLIE